MGWISLCTALFLDNNLIWHFQLSEHFLKCVIFRHIWKAAAVKCYIVLSKWCLLASIVLFYCRSQTVACPSIDSHLLLCKLNSILVFCFHLLLSVSPPDSDSQTTYEYHKPTWIILVINFYQWINKRTPSPSFHSVTLKAYYPHKAWADRDESAREDELDNWE